MAQVRPLPSIAPAPATASQRTHCWLNLTPLTGGSRYRCLRCGEIRESVRAALPPPGNQPGSCPGGITCPLCNQDDGTQELRSTEVWSGICCKPCFERITAVQVRPLRCGGCALNGRERAPMYFVLLPEAGGCYLCEDCTEQAQLGKPLD